MRRPKTSRPTHPAILTPAIVLALALFILGAGTASAELVAGGWLMPPRVPPAPPPRPVEAVAPEAPVAPVVRRKEAPAPRPVSRAPAQPAPPSDGKVRF